MEETEWGIPQDVLDKIDDEYLCRTLKEVPSSPMISQQILDAIPRKHFDLAYDTKSKRQKIDLYLPPEAGEGKLVPLVVFIHGGGFMAGDRRDMQVSVYFGLLNKGYALASIGYRVSGEAQFPDPVKDCKAAIRYLKAHAIEYGVDPSRFGVVGNSAGAYMALMMATTPNISFLEDRSTGDSAYGTDMRCCIATYAPVDFSLIDEQKAQEGNDSKPMNNPKVPECLFMGAAVDSLPLESIKAASPAEYLTPQVPPMMIKAGSKDELVPHTQSVFFANRAKQIAGDEKVDFEIVPGASHHDPAFKRPAFLEEACAFLDKYLK
jgi:acetyl esterase/lipase